jgi:hypothetical protein
MNGWIGSKTPGKPSSKPWNYCIRSATSFYARKILRHLGNIVANTGNPSASLPYFQQSLLIEEKTLGEDHPGMASLLLDYSSATLRAGKKSLSRKLRRRATDLLARLKSRSRDQMTVSLSDLRVAQ